jgi:hypothetical protein
VKAIFVNIFGGIMKCDVIAQGVVAAARQVSLKVPLVVRLEGTNVDLGKKILAESGLPIISASNMADGAQKVVAGARGKAPKKAAAKPRPGPKKPAKKKPVKKAAKRPAKKKAAKKRKGKR